MPVELLLPLVQALPLLLREVKRSIAKRHGDLQLEASRAQAFCCSWKKTPGDVFWFKLLQHGTGELHAARPRSAPAPGSGSFSPACRGHTGSSPRRLPGLLTPQAQRPTRSPVPASFLRWLCSNCL